jgi:hypothetical protein
MIPKELAASRILVINIKSRFERKGTGFPLELKLKMQKEMKRISKTCQILRAAPRVCFAIGITAPWLPTNLQPYFRGVSRTEVWILI